MKCLNVVINSVGLITQIEYYFGGKLLFYMVAPFNSKLLIAQNENFFSD